MGWTITDDLTAFETEATAFLRTRPMENSVPITVTAALRRRGPDAYGTQPPLFGWWRPEPGADVAAVFLRTPPHPPLLPRGDTAAARELAALWPTDALPGVRGDKETAETFGAAWRERTGAEVTVERVLRLYRLGTLTPRDPAPPGAARTATAADRDLLLRWQHDFAVDVNEPPVDDERAVDDAIARGARTLWEHDGEAVAMAGSAADPADAGTVRVLAVYTPPARRGRGYAGAVTTAVSRAARAAGARDVVLFADLANPVSNALYRHLGFAPVRDHVTLGFGAADAPV
ncbi:GNAT family N-acetyltransferase [Actinacidiphila alni]|uniref:GNAT family N-acetyltransferase n=1 Tax=Actinacidiphila alni TaxID=380248 RepID=UPI0033E129CE